MGRSEVILVTGADSCVGQHVIKQLHLDYEHVASIRTLDCGNYTETVPTSTFRGSCSDRALMQALLRNVTTVIHLMEHMDVSWCPVAGRMYRINVQETSDLLTACRQQPSIKRFILGSSVFVNVSNTWPSVWNPELDDLPPPSQQVFTAYTKTKLMAEQLVHQESDSGHLQTYIARLPPVYGECDVSSVFIQMFEFGAKTNGGVVPVIGDQGGVMQMAYAGNVAHGFLQLLRKLRADWMISGEVVFLLDDTPIVGVYELVQPYLTALQLSTKPIKLPFLMFYWCYRALQSVASMCPDNMQRWPDADYFYLWFYHWVFFSDFRARYLLEYKPKYSYEESVRRSTQYYKNMYSRATCTKAVDGVLAS